MEPQVHLADETWINRPPEAVRAAIEDPGVWSAWWPELDLRLSRDRGPKGLQWVARGVLRGTAEVWLEPRRGGTVLHCFLRLDAAEGSRLGVRGRRRRSEQLARRSRAVFWALKDALEAG